MHTGRIPRHRLKGLCRVSDYPRFSRWEHLNERTVLHLDIPGISRDFADQVSQDSLQCLSFSYLTIIPNKKKAASNEK